MSAKKRQTFDKMNRERAVREKRARKQEKKALRKLGALAESNGDGAPGDALEVETETPPPS
jgi:DNA-directed RNA polymerase sigma subunit (sigma70/sigma32)